MYVGRKHTTTTTTMATMPFSCIHCGAVSNAVVTGIGQGQGNSPFFLDESGAKTRAQTSASKAAEENARLTLRLARCPKCQRRDESAVRAVKWKTVLGVLTIVIAFPFMGLALDALKRSHAGLVIFAPLGVVTACLVYAQQKWKWESADGRVDFVDETIDG